MGKQEDKLELTDWLLGPLSRGCVGAQAAIAANPFPLPWRSASSAWLRPSGALPNSALSPARQARPRVKLLAPDAAGGFGRLIPRCDRSLTTCEHIPPASSPPSEKCWIGYE
jgi:hypothetical protein